MFPFDKLKWCRPDMSISVTQNLLGLLRYWQIAFLPLLVVGMAANLPGSEFANHGKRTSRVGQAPSLPETAPTSKELLPEDETVMDITDPVEARFLGDAADGRLDDVSFLEAVMIANGIRIPSMAEELRERFEAHVAAVRRDVEKIRDPQQRCVAVHEWMHRHVLVGNYQADCTQISRALRHGDYNCVSATLLFQLLCQACDLTTVAVATPTHVYARLLIDPARVDVQTTCPDWFRLSKQERRDFPRFSDHFPIIRQRGPSNNANWGTKETREISDVQLLAKVYYNRGVRHLDARRFEEAEREFRTSLLLDAEDRSAQENLLATLNNWALDLAEKQQYASAATVLNRGLSECPDYAPFQANDLHIHQKWALLLCRHADYGEALRILEAGQRRRPEVPLYRDGPQAVRRLWMKELVERRDYAGAWRIALGRARENVGVFPGPTDFDSLVELARQLAANGRRVDALRLLDEGLRLQADSPLLRRIRVELTAGEF